MKLHVHSLVVVGITASLAFVPGTAYAASQFAHVPQALVQIALQNLPNCGSTLSPAAGSISTSNSSKPLDKASALLGGQPSALESLRLQQAGQLSSQPASAYTAGFSSISLPMQTNSTFCQPFAPSGSRKSMIIGAESANPHSSNDFLASKLIPIRHTSFDAQWNRVRHQSLPRSLIGNLANSASPPTSTAILAAINAWVNARVHYVEDSDLYGKSDYWASADATLKRRAGDCEDIAIVKLQLLAALGIPRSDLFLTVARDLVRNADHAVLIVKLGNEHWMLDNSTNQLLNAATNHDYRPIMSFSQSGKWLHGYSMN